LRVPCILVSPWINKGVVIHDPPSSQGNHYTHTSILSTLKEVFDLPSFLTKRDAWSPTFTHVVDGRTSPRTDAPIKLPRPGTEEEQAKWDYFSKIRLNAGVLEGEIEKGNISTMPLADLQKEIIAIARGLSPGGPDSLDTAFGKAEEASIETEHHGALFVQRQIRDFRKRSEDAHKSKEKEQEGWFVV